MPYKALYILVEGDDDERFFRKVVMSVLEGEYESVTLWKYAQRKSEKVAAFLSSIESMGARYILVSDMNRAPCVTARKRELHDRFKNIDEDRIRVIIKEIESWYLAGLDASSSENLRIPCFDTTGSVTKEQFNGLIPRKFDSRIDFMQEILKYFHTETAKQKNASLRYFLNKHGCEV